MMTTITEINSGLLFEARLAVEGPFDDEAKVRCEVERYANGKDSRRDRMRAFVFVREGKVCGYIKVVGADDDLPIGAPALPELKTFGHLTRMGVVESERGQGLARQLLCEMESWLKSQGVPGVWLDYLPSNEPAARLYARNGFTDLVEFQDRRNRRRRIATKRF